MDIRISPKSGEVRNLRTPITGVTFELRKRSIYHFKGIFKGNNFYLERVLQSHQFRDEKAKKPILGHYNPPVGGKLGANRLLLVRKF